MDQDEKCYLCRTDYSECSGLFTCGCCSHVFCINCVLDILHLYQDMNQEYRDKIDSYDRLKLDDHWCPCYFREACTDVSGCYSCKEMAAVVNNMKF